MFDEAKMSRHDGLAPTDWRFFAESLRIVLELNQIEHIRVFSAQKAASSHHHRDRENTQV
jgi:hypothetical protein